MEDSPIVTIAANTTPAVISIVISKDMPKIEGFYSMPFEGKQYIIPKIMKGVKQHVKIGGGSGFFVSPDGIVLTNSHVVEDPEASYTVILDHGKNETVPLKILARDPVHDIAIAKIDKKNVPYLSLGGAGNLKLGQTVIAVGYALGQFSNTVSSGIISGLSRFIQAQSSVDSHREHLRGLIQTDAAINPGNSGGPLVNMEGDVIGINTAVVFGAQNIGFAIPIGQAKKDLEELKQYGHIRMPYLGIRYIMLTPEIAERNKLSTDHGALVVREILGEHAVIPGSPADKAGMKEYDVVLKVGNKKLDITHPLQVELEAHAIGEKIPLEIMRNGKKRTINVTLGEKNVGKRV